MTGTVTVGCRLPSGIILRLYEVDSEGLSTGVVKAEKRLQGANSPSATLGVGLTSDVDADFWDAWTKQNSTFQPFLQGHIFGYARADQTLGVAKEASESNVQSGMQQLDTDSGKDARMPEGITKAEA